MTNTDPTCQRRDCFCSSAPEELWECTICGRAFCLEESPETNEDVCEACAGAPYVDGAVIVVYRALGSLPRALHKVRVQRRIPNIKRGRPGWCGDVIDNDGNVVEDNVWGYDLDIEGVVGERHD